MRSLLLRRSELLLRATIVSPQQLNASAVRAIIMASNGVTPSSSSLCFNLFASGFGSSFDDFSGMVEVRNIGYYEEEI